MSKTARELMGEVYVAVRAAGWAEKFARPEADKVLVLLREAIAVQVAEAAARDAEIERLRQGVPYLSERCGEFILRAEKAEAEVASLKAAEPTIMGYDAEDLGVVIATAVGNANDGSGPIDWTQVGRLVLQSLKG